MVCVWALFRTKPNEPCSLCSQIKITERTKFGSFKKGFAISSVPLLGEIIILKIIINHQKII